MHNQDQTLPVHELWGRALAIVDGAPVWAQRGAADDDDDQGDGIDLDNPTSSGGTRQRDILDDDPDDDDDDVEPDDAGGEPDEPDAKKKPAATTGRTDADFEKLQKALDAERALRKKRDATLAEFRKKERAAQHQGDDEAAERARQAQEAAEARYKPVAIHAAAKAALLERNFQRPTEERIKKMVRRLDLEDIDVDQDGDVVGLDAQIDQLVDDFPELFTPPTSVPQQQPKPKAPKLTTANKPAAAPTYPTHGHYLAAKIAADQA